MSSLFRILAGLRSRVSRVLDDAAPMPPEEREERDWMGESSEDEAERRKARFRIRIFEKRGGGGRH